MKRWFLKVSLLFAALMMLSCMTVQRSEAYYGGGLYGGYGGLYGGLYGGYGGLYGSSLYGGLYGGYGGIYGGLYGGYGGLYGSSLYGGYGGIYGGLYGSSLYDPLGLSMASYGGLYGGLYNPFSLQNMYYPVETGTGITYQIPFTQIAPLLGAAGLYNALFPSLFNPQGYATPSVSTVNPVVAPTSSIIVT